MLYGAREDMEGMRQQYDRDLGDINYLERYLRERTKDMEMTNIRDRETLSDMEGGRLYPLEGKSKLDTR